MPQEETEKDHASLLAKNDIITETKFQAISSTCIQLSTKCSHHWIMNGSKFTSLVKLFIRLQIIYSDHYNPCTFVNAIERVRQGQDMKVDKRQWRTYEVRGKAHWRNLHVHVLYMYHTHPHKTKIQSTLYIPIVTILVWMKEASTNLCKIVVFPTEESPISNSLNRKSYGFAIIIHKEDTKQGSVLKAPLHYLKEWLELWKIPVTHAIIKTLIS